MRDFSVSVDTSKYTEADLDSRVEILFFDKPVPAIQRFYLNISYDFVDKFVFDGKIDTFAKFSMVGSQINICDFTISEKICIIGVTKDARFYILSYAPSNETSSRYAGKTYEDIFSEEREEEAAAYLEALTASGRVPSLKAKDILYTLMSEYVIDMCFINNSSPKIKLYDNATKYAEVITDYNYKYINRRINRIEFVEKQINIKYLGMGVKKGHISNDPYLLLSEVNNIADFPLTKPTYVWHVNDARQEELAIYTASENFNKLTYREAMEAREDPELRKEIDKLCMRFSNEAGYQVSKQYITGVIKKLNKELLVLPIDFIRKNTQESVEYIEPLRYKFSVVKNRKDFEGMLYNSIENNINGRYKYRFVEKLSGIYLKIGNKLNYTDATGNLIKKQSVADFNINYNSAIVKRETIIDIRSIPQLLGYIYNDIESLGTDLLPVPSVEVVFYFPEVTSLGREVEMYNGTAIDLVTGDGSTSYGEIGQEMYSQTFATKPKDPNEKYITVRYVNSDNEILKENIIRDMPIGSIYTPEIIPIINDKEGKEWHISSNHVPNVQVTTDNNLNVVEVRYVKKMARVRINYINKQGGELSEPVVKNMQVGETFDMESARKFKDRMGTEWNIYQTNPSKFVVSQNEDTNVLTLVYDVIKADVFISYKTRDGFELRPQEKISTVANQEFSPNVPKELVDVNGYLWEVGNDSKTVIFVSEYDLNAVELLYDEKKVRVITQFIDEEGTKIKDDVVELVQVGRVYTPKFENDYIDIYGKCWHIANVDRSELKIQKDETQNICIVSYSKVLSNITISLLNEQGSRIRDDIVEQAQIGTVFSPATVKEVEDVNGYLWTCIDDNKSLTVSQSEMQNKISFTYKPLMTRVFFKYVDDEGNEILPEKERTVQAGCKVQPEFIQSLVSKDQRGWILSPNNKPEFIANRHEEENIFEINYDKKLVNITLGFRNINGVKLKEDVPELAQIGSEYNPSLYDKITADNGERWMITKTEPEILFVRENSRFVLIYDEIKSKVVVKCVNISDNKSFIDDTVITTKLGGVFVPNIAQKIFDKKKRRWKYVGEPAMSIVTKENEQENIITLKYEPDVCNVTLKFINNFGQIVYKDIVKPEQIGSELAIKEYDKIIEENGIGWKLDNMSRKNIIVDESEEKNIVTSNYIPLLADVNTRYIDNDGNELTQTKNEKLQVGTSFSAEIIQKVKDGEGKSWIYSNIKVEPIIVKEETNKVNIKFVPLMKNVTSQFETLENERIIKDKFESIQVGTVYQMPEVKRVIDPEGKYWIFQKITRDKITVSENELDNVVEYRYDKELIEVLIQYHDSRENALEKDKLLKLQIGSKFKIEPPKVLFDNDKLGYIISDTNTFDVTISPNKTENVFKMLYDDYMVHVYDKFLNNESGQEIIKPAVSMHQVGSKYLVAVQETVIDEEGKHWLQAARGDTILLGGSYKVDPITVQEDESRNFTVVKYKPKLAMSTIKYLDPMGNPIKTEEQKKLQIGSKFGESIPKKVIDSIGNKWSFNPKSKSDVIISENPVENVIELSYVEAQGTVTIKHFDPAGNEIVSDTSELVQIGNNYTPNYDMVVTDDQGCVWEYSERDKETLVVSDNDDENIVKVTYIPMNIDVLVEYLDLWGNEVSPAKIEKAQLGSKYRPKQSKLYTNEQSLLYRIKRVEPEEITIKEIPIGQTETPNKFTIVFDPVMSDVIIQYYDLNDMPLRDDERIQLQVGSKYTPEPPQYIKDPRGSEWELVNAKKDEITVFENSDQNVLRYSYDVAKADVIIRCVNVDGIVIQDEQHIPMQVGQEYVPAPEPYVVDKENKKWKMLEVKPVNLRVGSINNIVTVTYQEAKTKVTWKFIDESGNEIKSEERYEVQIGQKYSPKVTNKVIYNDSEIWRLVKTEPYEIIISENSEENIVNLIYSNKKVQEEEEKKQELVNPFANTITAEEEELMRLSNKQQNVFDASQGDSLTANEDSVIFRVNDNTAAKTAAVQDAFEFTDPHLQALARGLKLSNSEKITINDLNDLNTQIVEELRKARDEYIFGGSTYDYSYAESLIIKEKDTIKANMDKIIAQDKTGSRILKIFEHITASENDDKTFGKVQQKKAILITDYFIDKPVEDMDKVIYICERGKNAKEISIINDKIASGYFKNPNEANELKAILYYEKMMIDNYYKARTLACDNYFIDPASKETLGDEITAMVNGMLVNQAKNILSKDNLTLAQRTEVEAIISLCSDAQIAKIKENVSRLDGKQKKTAAVIFKEMEKRK